MGVAAILLMWSEPFKKKLWFPHPKESPYVIWVHLAQWFQREMFENVGGRQTTESLVYY